MLRHVVGADLVVRDLGAAHDGLQRLPEEEVATPGGLEGGHAPAVPVLHVPPVVLVVELAVLLELRIAGDRVRQLLVGNDDPELLRLLQDQLLVHQ